MDTNLENLSDLAHLNLRWMVRTWRQGCQDGNAFDLDANDAADYDSHPVVVSLRELESQGWITISEDEMSRLGWSPGADLTARGRALAEDEAFDDQVPPELFL
ncbi:hypothetical protein [Deinococcus sp. QL22]|uniref:hypothetical protein n=1 Tax=Deinococcus sp. QL22 TaxID=2939437 RepID=UPI002016B29D|nr:hypothetical protein [Deinococcus sp. QL22]UQN10558.1 hypothetical protein M1R55_30620 [Deinococcus sp. QL22]